MITQTHKKGFLLLEIIVAIAILGILATTVLSSVSFLIRRLRTANDDVRAGVYLQNGVEATYHILARNLSAYPDGSYHLALSGGRWVLAAGPETIDKYTREIIISTVCRTGAGDRADCSVNAADVHSKAIDVTVVWAGAPEALTAQLLVPFFE